MRDRIPGAESQAGRVLITPEGTGQDPFHATLTQADNPIEAGTAWNKANVLSDDTAKLVFGNDAFYAPNFDPTPDEAFAELARNVGGGSGAAGLHHIELTAGTNTYSATHSDIVEYFTELAVSVRFAIRNTGAASLNINGLGARAIQVDGQRALISGEIDNNSMHLLVMDNSGNWQLLSQRFLTRLGDVSGTLAVTNGGTGLTAQPSMLTNLGTAAAANVLTATPRPGVTGVLPIANGGTGATTAQGAVSNLFPTSNPVPVHFATFNAAHAGHGWTTMQQARVALGLGNTIGAVPIANGGTGGSLPNMNNLHSVDMILCTTPNVPGVVHRVLPNWLADVIPTNMSLFTFQNNFFNIFNGSMVEIMNANLAPQRPARAFFAYISNSSAPIHAPILITINTTNGHSAARITAFSPALVTGFATILIAALH